MLTVLDDTLNGSEMQNPQIEPDGELPVEPSGDSNAGSADRLNGPGEREFGAAPTGNSESSALGGDLPGESNELSESQFESQFYTLDSQFIKSERLGSIVFVGLLILGALIWITIQWMTEGVGLFLQILAGLSIVVIVSVGYLSWVWPKKVFKNTRWRATDEGLEIHKGVFWRHRIIVPMSRVQHADVTQGPIQRMFGLGTLVVHTAGTSNASVELGGIDHQGAIEIRDMIIRFRSVKRES